MLKLARHIGQLFARSTQGLRQLLCRSWPQGSRWATISSSWTAGTATSLSLAWCWGRPSAACSWRVGAGGGADGVAAGPSSRGTRSPRQTMHVSAIGVVFAGRETNGVVAAIHMSGRWSSRESGDRGLSTRTLVAWLADHSSFTTLQQPLSLQSHSRQPRKAREGCDH